MTNWDAEAQEVVKQAINEWQHDPLLTAVGVVLVPRITALARRAERKGREAVYQLLVDEAHADINGDPALVLAQIVYNSEQDGYRRALERAAEIVGTFIARDIVAFNAHRTDNPLWTTALVDACGPVLRQVAAAIRREIERGPAE